MAVMLKTAVPPATVADAARRAVYAVDASLPVSNVRTLEQIVARSISQPRFYMSLLTVFAGVAVTLAAIGIFGVLSYAVAQRTREIGIRMALGAHERTVVRLIVREAMIMAAAGVVIGIGVALPLTNLLVAKLLFGTSPRSTHIRERRRAARHHRAGRRLRSGSPRHARRSDCRAQAVYRATVPDAKVTGVPRCSRSLERPTQI